MGLNTQTAILLVGGESTRMGRDKFLIAHHGIPHWKYMFDILSRTFDAVWISCREDQAAHFPNQKLILDPAESMGPMGGIIQAFLQIPEATTLFFVGCDLPNFNSEIPNRLRETGNSSHDMIAAQSDAKSYPEPLVAIWNRSAVPLLQERASQGNYALFQAMKSLQVQTVQIADDLLKNVNRPEDLG